MTFKPSLESLYEEYLTLEEKTKLINGEVFHLAVSVYELRSLEKLFVVFPWDVILPESTKLKDENGNVYERGGHVHCHFSGDIPRWYLECSEFELIDSDRKSPVGKYFAFY